MNKKWKIAFCGLGSIGSRHLRNIMQVLEEREDTYLVDWIANTARPTPKEFKDVIRNCYTYEDTIDSDYDIIFVTNPTYMHFKTIKKYQWNTKSLFIEKPLYSDDSKTIEKINPECIYYIACPIRYKKVIQFVKNNINPENVLSAIAVCSSYLPEWRKGTDYRKGYSALKSMGGGVSLDLIHELDYIFYLFGMPNEIYNIRGHVSTLEIDSDDVSVYIARLNKAIVQVYVDYIGKSDIRNLTLFCKEDTVEIDLLKNKIKYLRAGKSFDFDEQRDDFQMNELRYFLDIFENKKENINDMCRAYQTLKATFGRI